MVATVTAHAPDVELAGQQLRGHVRLAVRRQLDAAVAAPAGHRREVVRQGLGTQHAHRADAPRAEQVGCRREICAGVRPHHDAGSPLNRQSSGWSARAPTAAALIGFGHRVHLSWHVVTPLISRTRSRPAATSDEPTFPSSSGSVRPSASGCSPRGASRIRSRSPRTHTLAEIRAGLPRPAARHRDRRPRRRRGPGGVRPQLRQALLRHAAGGRRHPAAGDDQPRQGRRRIPSTRGSPMSTSATSSSCTAR